MKVEPTQTKQSNGWGWIWWVLFPPYAMYRFARYNPLKWYFKTPILLILSLVVLLSVDLAANPHRVEEAEAEKTIMTYLEKESPTESFRKIERVGRGYSIKGKEVQEVVYYRALTGMSLYEIGLTTTDGKRLSVDHAEQLYPIRIEAKDMKERTNPEVAVWLYENESLVGKPKELVENRKDELTQEVKTEKGTFEFKVGNQSVYEVNDIKKKSSILKRENEPVLPEEIADYLKKNESKVGELSKVLAYELDNSKEKYYFRTTKGDFLTESYDDGTIDIKKRNESKE